MKHFFTKIMAISGIIFMLPFVGIAQQTYVPDDNFEQQLIDLGLDWGPLDDYVLTGNIDTLTRLYVYEKEIHDLTGIEDFAALKKLDCYDNFITNLDLSSCNAMEDLNCYRNGLTSLNLNNCSSLVYLRCYNNALTVLDVGDCTSLEFLNCKMNSLTSLDLHNCTALEELVCTDNLLTSINTNGLVALKFLYCYGNAITSLNVITNSALYELDCNNNALTAFNASGCTHLEWLFCPQNALISLNLSNCTSLDWLICNDNALTSIDISDNTALRFLSCNNNLLTSLDVSMNAGLLQLICNDNALTSLNLKNGTNTNMQGNQNYAGLDVRGNPNLACIQVDDAAASSGYLYWNKDASAVYSEDCGINAVEYLLSESVISLYPNPASSDVNIQSTVGSRQSAVVEFFDLNGRKLLEKHIPAGTEETEIDVSQLLCGMYFCRITAQECSTTKKITIQR